MVLFFVHKPVCWIRVAFYPTAGGCKSAFGYLSNRNRTHTPHYSTSWRTWWRRRHIWVGYIPSNHHVCWGRVALLLGVNAFWRRWRALWEKEWGCEYGNRFGQWFGSFSFFFRFIVLKFGNLKEIIRNKFTRQNSSKPIDTRCAFFTSFSCAISLLVRFSMVQSDSRRILASRRFDATAIERGTGEFGLLL